MTHSRLVFDAAAAFTVLFAAVMVVHRHPVKSVLAVVVSFFGLAVCYVLLSAPFIAAIQVIVYAGAILVLFLFVLMLLNIPEEAREPDPRPIQRFLSGAAILVFAAALLGLIRSHGAPQAPGLGAAVRPTSRRLPGCCSPSGLLPFEALSVLLLAALVGAYVLAQRVGNE